MGESNVKPVTLVSSGLIARQRIHLRGLYYVAQQSGNIILLDGGSGAGGGVTTGTIHVEGGNSAIGNSSVHVSIPVPGKGMLFAASAFAQITGASSVTFWVEGT